MDVYIRDAIEVIPSESFQQSLVEETVEPEPVIESAILEEPLEEATPGIPGWIKTTTLWWSDGNIDDDEFIKAIQYLVQEKIIQIPSTDSESESLSTSMIPDWIRNTATWWTSDAISDKEFIAAIQFLVKNGIITV
jgi:hypothetical protein